MQRRRLLLATALAAPVLGLLAWQAAPGLGQGGGRAVAAEAAPASHSPAKSRAPHGALRQDQRRAFFGELHLHTTMSFDAWSFGTKVTPDQAYRFGRGETVMIPGSQIAGQQKIPGDAPVPAKRSWPLDFMAVTDHAEMMGALNQLDDPTSPIAQSASGKALLKNPASAFYIRRGLKGGQQAVAALNVDAAAKSAWAVEVKAANDNYIPGKFTTFIAYEWTSAPDGKNLHRNVFFNSDHAPLPFTSAQSLRPEDLWSYLEKVRADGIDVIAIPHNGNVSGGLMFDWNDSDGRPIDEAYAQRRALNEPLTEIVQNKGQSDTVPSLSPNDEFANFEIFDHLISRPRIKSPPGGSYVRDALGRGLVIEARTGVNPYKLGVVGGSDIHNGLSTSEESGFAAGPFGIDPKTMTPRGAMARQSLDIDHVPAGVDTDVAVNNLPPVDENNLMFSSGGITGVWAERNSRDSIFAALKRKETFATSGTRIRLRMFGGWGFDPAMTRSDGWVAKAYAKGVAMGGDLPAAPGPAAAPTLILQAMKDPDGANLDRIQVIKMWREGDAYKERIFDVALSGGRKTDPKTHHAAPVGNTVDLRTGKYANSIGAPILLVQWTDPAFDPSKAAVYYARALEIPTPRWSTLLAVSNHLPIPKTVPATIQERAWSSPIWYTPPGSRKTAAAGSKPTASRNTGGLHGSGA